MRWLLLVRCDQMVCFTVLEITGLASETTHDAVADDTEVLGNILSD